MLNATLVGLLAGSLSLGSPDGGDDKKNPHADKAAPATVETAPAVLADDADATPRSITQDTYALGIPSDMVPLRFWASYALGEAEGIWNLQGEEDEAQIAFTDGDIVSQRLNFGAQINALNFPSFKIGAGAQLTLAKNEFQVGEGQGANPPGVPAAGFIGEDIGSDFGLQNVKVFGVARGRVLGVHGGYIFDIGNEREFSEPVPALGGRRLPTSLSTSDGRDAIFFGADFDVPSDVVRVFGGIDYFMLQGIEDDANTFDLDESELDNDDFLNFLLGLGVKVSFFEVGAAFQIQTRHDNPTVLDIGTTPGIGSHAGTVAPYLRISPPSLPASLFIKGAVQEEYTEYGYAIGGANSVRPSLGFTAGLSVGFD